MSIGYVKVEGASGYLLIKLKSIDMLHFIEGENQIKFHHSNVFDTLTSDSTESFKASKQNILNATSASPHIFLDDYVIFTQNIDGIVKDKENIHITWASGAKFSTTMNISDLLLSKLAA